MTDVVVSPGAQRLALAVEYAGATFNGWQKQRFENVTSVQYCVEEALSHIAAEPIKLICAGRTDTGVSATWQIVHFDTHAQRPMRGWVMGANTRLPNEIAIKWVQPVSTDFHARFSAQARRYRYFIISAPVKPAILDKGLTWTYKKLDVARMQAAAKHLIGEHDFNAYRAVGCQAKSPVRTLSRLKVYRHGRLIVIDVEANAFLHHMVRNIAGVLMKIGAEEAEVDWTLEVLNSRDRREGGVTAPPFGLYLVDVTYDKAFGLPASELGPHFIVAP